MYNFDSSGSTETVVEASPIGKKGSTNKKRPENLEIGAPSVVSVVGRNNGGFYVIFKLIIIIQSARVHVSWWF